MEKKTCKTCRQEKPKDDDHFHKHPDAADGYLNVCKDCVNERTKKQRASKKEVRNPELFYHDENLATI